MDLQSTGQNKPSRKPRRSKKRLSPLESGVPADRPAESPIGETSELTEITPHSTKEAAESNFGRRLNRLRQSATENPRRHPSWRWQRAGHLVENGLKPTRRDDRYVHKAYRFQQGLAGTDRDKFLLEQLDKQRDLTFAYDFWIENDTSHRDILEACILARQTPKEIEASLGVSPRTVEMFERLFYDVRERLDVPGYVDTVLIGPELQGPLTKHSRALALKWAGYYGGPLMVDWMLGIESRQVVKPDRESLNSFFEKSTARELARKALLAALLFLPDDRTARRLLDITARLLRLEYENPHQGSSTDALHEGMDCMMREIQRAFTAPSYELVLESHSPPAA